jgi:hypothetical protein
MKKQKLVFKLLVLFILCIGGINLCQGQAVCDVGEFAYDGPYDDNGNRYNISICLVLTGNGGADIGEYCNMFGMLFHYGFQGSDDTNPATNTCTAYGGLWYNKASIFTPISDATPFLILLLGIYALRLYRKRKGAVVNCKL